MNAFQRQRNFYFVKRDLILTYKLFFYQTIIIIRYISFERYNVFILNGITVYTLDNVLLWIIRLSKAFDKPYVGFGHKLLPGETFTPDMTKAQADSLLRADLLKLCCMCSRFGKDALLVATLSYNVGYYRLVGNGKIPKSRLIQKLESGDRDIYQEYISFRCYKGKVVPSIERRRKKEFELLFEE